MPVFVAIQKVVAAGTSHSASSSTKRTQASAASDIDLIALAALWPRLPEVIRNGIVAMAQAAAMSTQPAIAESPAFVVRALEAIPSSTPAHRAAPAALHQPTQGDIS